MGKILVGDARLATGESLFVPYWSIVLPLTLLSAWLLLGQPRAKLSKSVA
ncbi:hypothetical protein [Schlesneria paludicola]|nr:hypothetical protein [Schlesneria paludicola]